MSGQIGDPEGPTPARVAPGGDARLSAAPVGLVGAITAAPRGIVAGADIILTIPGACLVSLVGFAGMSLVAS